MMDNLKTELLEQIEKLTPVQQKQVLDFALELTGELAKRYPGEKLLKLVGTISPEDLEIMKQTIEEDAEWHRYRKNSIPKNADFPI